MSVAVLLGAAGLMSQTRPDEPRSDILIADFEGPHYGGWEAEGTAFGDRPARANVTPPNKVTGHQGKGLVNTYLDGDGSTGTLTSPEFTIERKHINFLIGAGNFPGKSCMNLLVGGKVVRTAVGLAVKNASRQEVLDWKSWNVSELVGKKATLQIVDRHTRGWGHINVDQIVQSDKPRKPTYVYKAEARASMKSRVPKYTFANTLAEQEEQLKTNPLLARFRASRKELLKAPHHPRYHFVSPEHRLNDPDGLCFWKGRWHMFYQGYPPEDPRQHWGHAVSDDLIHWRDLPYAIYPDPERACFSGSTLVEDDRVIAMYHGTQVGSMVAVSSDPLLLNWEKVTGKAVIPFPAPGEPAVPYNIFDPCIWKKEGMYYALTAGTLPNGPGGKPVRAEFLHRSKDLAKWEYLHPFLEDDRYGIVGDDGACPYFWPIGERHILLHYSHTSGGKYMLGDYDKKRDKFKVTDGGDFNFGPSGPCGVHAPSATPDGKGGVVVIFNMNPGKRHDGWNQIMSLPRLLTLAKDTEPGVLDMQPAGDVESLRHDHQHVEKRTLPANTDVVLEKIQGNSMELAAEIDCKGSQMIELCVLRSPKREEVTRIMFYKGRGYRRRGSRKRGRTIASTISIDTSYSSSLPDARCRAPETAQLALGPREPLSLRVFVDRSVVEVFVNGWQCVAVRVYPGRPDSIGVSLRSQGSDAVLNSLDAWQMKSIYD